MYKLVVSETLGRKIRKDDWDELGVPTWTLLEQAISEQKTNQALELLDHLFNHEVKFMHDLYTDWVYGLLTYIANTFGEEKINKALRSISMINPLDDSRGALVSAEELMQRLAEAMRAHCAPPGEITISEEEDRYVLSANPCGSGWRMFRNGKTKPPYNFGVTQEPYPWSWSKVGVPYYCAHCALWTGIMAIEKKGYPVRVHEFPDTPEDSCRMIIYKNPALIPERYFTELGMKKQLFQSNNATSYKS